MSKWKQSLISLTTSQIINHVDLYNMMTDSTNSIEAQTKKIPQESPKQRKLMLVTLGLLTNLGISNWTYIVIIIIEFLQLFGIVVAGNYYTQWNGVVFDKIKEVTTMLTIQGVIRDYPSAHSGLLIACIMLLLMVLIVLVLLSKYGSEMLNTSQLEKVMAKIVSFVVNLVKTMLEIPLFVLIIQGIISGLKGNEGSAQLLGLSLGLAVILIPYIAYAIIIFTDLNPFNESMVIFSGEISRTKLINTLFKLGLVLYNLLDSTRQVELTTLVILMLIQVMMIIFTHRSKAQQQFSKYVKLVKLWLRYVLVLFILFMVVGYHTSSEPASFIYFFIMIISSLSLIHFIEEYFENRILHENFMELVDPCRIESHALRIIELIDSAHERPSKLLLQGYIAFHVRNCNLPESSCQCRELSANKLTQIQNRKQVYYEMLVNLLRGSIPRTNQPRRIYLILSYIYQHRLKNRYQAIHCLIRSRTCTANNIMERIEYLTQMKLVQEEMVETENKKHNSMAVDMMKFLHFNIRIVEFEKILDQCTNNHIEFWKQILEVNLNIQKLQNCGAIIANEKEAVKEEFHEMIDLNNNNAHIMILYGQFLAWVCNEDFQHSKLLEKGETILKNMKESSKINGKNDKYCENSKTTIIIISGNEKEMGKIVQTNNFIKQTIGYNRKELINHNISKLMPKVFAEHHNLTLSRFLTTSKDRYNGIQRLVPVLCQQGFIVPSLAYTKPIPNLIDGIQIVGFLSEYNHVEDEDIYEDKVSYILYECDSETVMGISKSCQQEYGIPKCLVYGSPNNSINELKTKHIFGFNLEKSSEHGIENGKQILATIDTKLLQDQFIISSVASTRKIIEENVPRSHVKNQVILRSVLELVYHGIPLRLISVTKEYNHKEQEHRRSIKQSNENKEQRSDSKSQTDDLKDLKDFKNFISIKRQPKAIRFVNFSCKTIIILFTLGVASYIFLHIKQLAIISSTMQGIELAFLNRMYLTELLFEDDKIFINHNDGYPPGELFPERVVINKMNDIIKSVRESQMNLQPIKNNLEVPAYNASSFVVYPNQSVSTVEEHIDEAMIAQLTKLSTIANTGGNYLKASPVNYRSVTVLSYLETIYTQIFSFTYSCSLIQQAVQDQGKSKSQNIELILIMISVSLMVITMIWLLVSLPKTLQVADINSKVLSLFSLIAAEDVRGVIKRCYIFQNKYLVESEVDIAKIQELNMQEVKANKFKDTEKRKSAFGLGLGDTSFNTVSLNSLNNSQLDTSARVILNPATAKRKQFSNFQNFDDNENEDKMINKGNGDKTKAIVIFVLIFVYMTAFAGSIMGYLMMNYRNMNLETKTMNQIYNRTAQFQELKSSYTKYLMDRTLSYKDQSISKINLDLITRMYDTERFLVEDQMAASFMSILNRLNTENICSEIQNFKSHKVWGADDLSTAECETVNNGILKRGIKTSLVTTMEEIRSIIALPEDKKLQMNMPYIAVETKIRYTILEKYLVRPLLMVSSQIANGITSEYFHINLIFYMISGVFLLSLVLFWKFAWNKYLDYLNESVWRTKSMLNVIPSKIITNNELLMSEFTSGQLEKIVK